MAEGADDLTGLVTPARIRRLAGDTYYERGETYFDEGAVRTIRPWSNGFEAKVRGTYLYRVRFRTEDGELLYHCDCPIGRDGAFCKHCVAAGLAWHAGGAPESGRPDRPAGQDLRTFLMSLDKEELVSLLLDQADEDEGLYHRLAVRSAISASGPAHESVWRQSFSNALQTDDMISYDGMYGYVREIEGNIEHLADMIGSGQAESVIRLAEYGLDEVEEYMPYLDDSDGWMGDLLYRLQDLHLQACEKARPEPEDLAERLFETEICSEYDIFAGAALTYAEVLGQAGLAVYRRLAEAEWAKIPAFRPGEDNPQRYGQTYRITSIMEALAEAEGDFEALVSIKSRDLSMPYDFLEIAKLYRDRGETDLALDWAKRGWEAFPGARRDDRLRSFIADIYQTQKHHDEALALVWDAFEERPGIDSYRALKRHGQIAGEWAGWRDKALRLLRERSAAQAAGPTDSSWAPDIARDRSLLVQILLDEDDAAGAWREAQAGGCAQTLWLRLAKTREKSHPDDAVRIYRDHVDALLLNTGNQVYEDAVRFLAKIEAVSTAADTEAVFDTYLTELRDRHKRKRNLIRLFDQRGW